MERIARAGKRVRFNPKLSHNSQHPSMQCLHLPSPLAEEEARAVESIGRSSALLSAAAVGLLTFFVTLLGS